LIEPRNRSIERSLLRERADVQFVDDVILERDALPVIVVPRELGGHDFTRTMNSMRLQPRCGIGQLAFSDREEILRAGVDVVSDAFVIAVACFGRRYATVDA